MRIFITGISGYAGFHAALRLAAAGHAVTGIARRPDAPRLNLLRAHEIAIMPGDASQPESYREQLERSDVFIHAMLDRNGPLATDRALLATLATLPAHVGNRRRFIYTTGCSIFGKVGADAIDESQEPNPAHPLGFRRVLELEALALPNLNVAVVRPGFMYGNDGYNSIAVDWFEMAESGEAVFRGDRTKGWSWVHIDDLAEAYRLIAEADARVDAQVFHLADDKRPLCVDVMRTCIATAGYTGELQFAGIKEGDNVSSWFDQNEFVTSEKARRILGWQPRHAGILADAPAAYTAWKAAQQLH